MHSPSQQICGKRRGSDLGTADRRINRCYVLHPNNHAAASAVLDGPMRDWLPSVLALRIEHRTLVTIEVSGGWALAAIQANTLAVPDAVALKLRDRPNHSGPWPDALLENLAGFRARVPTASRIQNTAT